MRRPAWRDVGSRHHRGWRSKPERRGRHVFGVGAEDVARNAWVRGGGVGYAVETDVCLAPPQGLKAWLRFDGDVLDATGGSVVANSQMPPDGYVAGELSPGQAGPIPAASTSATWRSSTAVD